MNIAAATRSLLPPLVAACARYRLHVILVALVLAAASLWATYTWLGVTTDTGGMFANNLAWKQRSDRLSKLFPQNSDLIVAVIDARIPEEADATANALAHALAGDTLHFHSIRRPDDSPYLQRNAFLLVDTADLQDLLNRTIDAQPFLGQLVADPSLRGLFSALSLVTQGIEHGASIDGIDPALDKFHQTLKSAIAGHPAPLSWQELLGGRLSDLGGRYRFVVFLPVLDFGQLEPGGAATEVVRKAAAAIPYVHDGQARVRLTGDVVLADEEFATVAEGAAIGLIGSFLLVMVWLFLAVRTWRLMLPIVLTLVLGLVLTTGFAAVVIGTLNLISIAFAVLFVGIAVDFAIQFAVRFRERRYNHPHIAEALRETGRRSGAQILVASLATAAGFLAFTPTKFVGVAQLGVIAGIGMLIAFTCTLTFLPATLCLCHPRRERKEIGFAFARPLDPVIQTWRWPVVAVFVLVAAGGAVIAHTIKFDGDPLHTKDPRSEAIRTLYDLMQNPVTNPYTIEALLPSLNAAQEAARKLSALKLTQEVLTLNSFLPTQQTEKLALIQDASSILAATLAPPATTPPVTPPVTPQALRAATVSLADALDRALPTLPINAPMRLIAGDLNKLRGAPDATLLAANEALTRFLPLQLSRLRTALDAHRVTLTDVPPDLRRDWVLPDGTARLQALPKGIVNGGQTLRSWVKAALMAVPAASGSAVWILKSADTIINAFRIAAYSALAAIAVILALALQRWLDVVLVMTPLLISGLITALLLAALGMSLNFANIIALPLLLGVGVSFNIYFVMNWRSGARRFLGTATARAVLFSALTTSTAFGSLALSRHPGTASMGILLLMSLGSTVVTTLLFMPALLAIIPRPAVPLGGGPRIATDR